MGTIIVSVMNVVVLINGTVTVSKNYAEYYVVEFGFSDITFTKTANFLSNICFNVIHLKSLDLPYMKILNYTNITFTNNICSDEVISIQAAAYDVFPPCFYQYMVSTNITEEMLRLYSISFDNKPHKNADPYNDTLLYYLTHCKWLPKAVFNGHDPGYVNQQIIQFNGHT